jgi:hypothetical protein
MNALQRLLEQLQGAHTQAGVQEPGSGHLQALRAAQAGFAGQPVAAQAGVAPLVGGQLGGSQAGDPLTNLVAGFQKWSQAHGQGPERYRDLAEGQRTLSGQVGGPGEAVRQVTDPSQQGLAQLIRVNQSGNARQGQGFETYELGHGLAAHIYYDPKTGKRQVVKFRRPAA